MSAIRRTTPNAKGESVEIESVRFVLLEIDFVKEETTQKKFKYRLFFSFISLCFVLFIQLWMALVRWGVDHWGFGLFRFLVFLHA